MRYALQVIFDSEDERDEVADYWDECGLEVRKFSVTPSNEQDRS